MEKGLQLVRMVIVLENVGEVVFFEIHYLHQVLF